MIFLVSQNASFALEIGYFGERSERLSERQRASFPLNMRLKRLGLKKFRLRRQLFQGCALAAAFGCSIGGGGRATAGVVVVFFLNPLPALTERCSVRISARFFGTQGSTHDL